MSVLFNLIIEPLKFLLELSFSLFFHVFKNPGISILGVSLAVTLMCLPLYIVAEKWQDKEREIQQSMKDGIERIKKAFKGDEQYMILNTYYRQHHYHPMMALRSSFSLLIQIPFFMAAYSYISHLTLLNGRPFFFIRDMGAPDALFSIGSFTINILPIVMTLINCASGFVYSKGHGLREKLQIYVMAALFLVILYNSPSGLVIYWTMNQVFSFLKNVFMKFKNPLRKLYYCMVASIVFLDLFVLFVHGGSFTRRLAMAVCASSMILLPVFVFAVKKSLNSWFKSLVENPKEKAILFFTSVFSLFLLYGGVIPGSVFSSSVIEFANIDSVGNPVNFMATPLVFYAGLMIFWPACLYFLFGQKFKACLALTATFITVSSIVNTFAFVASYGTLTRLITFTESISGAVPLFQKIINILATLAVLAAVIILAKQKLYKILSALTTLVMLVCLAMTFVYSAQISSGYEEISKNSVSQDKSEIESVFHLSKTGKNVVLFMLDRAESAYMDSIFEEDPSLKDIYTGFTFYPNTISFGGHTIIGVPPIYGGYEYTPDEFNKRNTEKKLDKHNESLRVLPKIFGEQENFSVTVSDTSWANYSWISDMSMFSGMKNVTALNLEYNYTGLWMKENPGKIKPNMVSNSIKRNIKYLSIFRSLPFMFRDLLYDDGLWWNTDKASGDIQEFLDYYSVLDYMVRFTDFEGSGNTFFAITNDATHSNFQMEAPDYVPSADVDSSKTGNARYSKAGGYSGNIAAFKLLGKWINYLKENGVYDNTRIIMVSDHGIGKYEVLGDYNGEFNDTFNRDHLHPILFVKDFNSQGELKKDYTFMTTADVPLLCLKDIVEKPVNPYTGKELTDEIKRTKGAIVTSDSTWSPDQHGSYTFNIKESDWYTVKDNIFESSNWKKGKE